MIAGRDEAFSHLAELAAGLCWAPIGMVSVVLEPWLYLTGAYGVDADRVLLERSLGRHVMEQEGVFQVEDVAAHPKFAKYPVMMTGRIGFYAGAPIHLPSGQKIGAICVCDVIPRELKVWQVRGLKLLAEQTDQLVELRLRQAG
ncbi:hypothetical protein D1Y84_08090 [Acidipila sp. EB88]|nr:hypothetical protein D1Y84_08090 [Acidipila sp. EB88]